MNRPVSWNRALRALIAACLLVATVRFVLVEVRLVGLNARARRADRHARPSPGSTDEE